MWSGWDSRRIVASNQALLSGVACFTGLCHAVQRFQTVTDGITDTKTAMWILLGGNALNIVGNYILINGKLGFPEMGLLGAGISTLFSRIVMVVVFAAIVLRGRRFIRYRLGFMRLGWSMPMFKKLNALGWPVGMQMVWRPLPSV